MHILYSFKRCPYAMRARMVLYLTNIQCEIREVSLRNKPSAMLDISPKGTVPVLLLDNGTIIEESLDLIDWALEQRRIFDGNLSDDQELFTQKTIKLFDTDFKFNLDRYKYSTRYVDVNEEVHKNTCLKILRELDKNLIGSFWFFGDEINKLDISILPFIRQFRLANIKWFDDLDDIKNIKNWLNIFLKSDLLKSVMEPYEPWFDLDEPIYLPKVL
jgi:glutathione S-transferase